MVLWDSDRIAVFKVLNIHSYVSGEIKHVSVMCCFSCLVRSPGARGHISRYVNYGMHEGNEFHYNQTLKMLTVFYFGERKHIFLHWIFAFIMTSQFTGNSQWLQPITTAVPTSPCPPSESRAPCTSGWRAPVLVQTPALWGTWVWAPSSSSSFHSAQLHTSSLVAFCLLKERDDLTLCHEMWGLVTL